MPRLKDALESAVRRKRSVLVLGADADRLSVEIEALVAPLPVVTCDCREGVPPQEDLESSLESGLRAGGVAHVAIGSSLDPRLLDTLSSIIYDGRFPGRDRDPDLSAAIVLSTPVDRASDLGGGLNEFMTMVGSAEHRSRWIPPPFKQAVVLIHGIGEQEPMETLKEFVKAVLSGYPDGEQAPKYRAPPDDASPGDISGELRKLVAHTREEWLLGDEVIVTPRRTDFFEFYWADIVGGTTLRDVLNWFGQLLFRRPPRHLVPLWGLSWLFIAIGLLGASLGIADRLASLTAGIPAFAISVAGFVGFAVFQTVVIYYIGDAARYLRPAPRNIQIRKKIRDRGLCLIRKIISSGEYDRLVVVGHSLGSVIAYDVLRQLWESKFEHALIKLEAYTNPLSAATAPNDHAAVEYQSRQIELWNKLRNQGNPWPITDLITVGSPLAHAALLFRGDLEARQRAGELATNPPQTLNSSTGNVAGAEYSDFRTALFACTRWTNIYFPTRFAVFGDFVAGPLRRWFGPGIWDRSVTSRRFFRRCTPQAHTSYWRPEASSGRTPGGPQALDALVQALDLNGERLGIARTERRRMPQSDC